jgi:hypothetical protein
MRNCAFFALFSCFLAALTAAIAASGTLYPKGCNPETTNFQYDTLYLGTTPGKEQHRVFVIKNGTYQPVMVTQSSTQSALASHFDAVINPGTWSAILTEQDNFEMQCYEMPVGGSEPWQVSCSEVVNACELRVSPIMHSARGQYWITKNQFSQRDLFGELRSHGIFP